MAKAFGKKDRSRCRFCRGGDAKIDYKDLQSLSKMVSAQGKMLSRKRTGNCAKCQREARRAIKRARFLALMPFVG